MKLLERENAEGVFNILKNPKTNFVIMKKLERDIDKKEKKIKELETKLFDKEIYTNITKINEINDMIESLTKEIDKLYDEWENMSEL